MVQKQKLAAHPDAVFAAALFIAISLFFGIWLVWDATFFRLATYSQWADYWEHSALLTEWLRDFASPGNPHVDDASLSPRYMPWFWLLTVIGLAFGLDSIDLMSLSEVANYLLIVIGLHLFLKEYFRDPWAPLIGFFAIFMFWGVSWNWSNLYQLKSFFYVAGYPSSFVFGLSLISFWATLRTLRGDEKSLAGAFILVLLSALMFLCHPLTGVFGIVGCGLLTLTEQTTWGRRFAIWIALLLGLVVAEAWPYFSVWKVALGLYGEGVEKWGTAGPELGMLERFRSDVWKHIFYNPRLVVIILGPALLGVPVCLWLLARREYLFIVAGAAAMSVPYFGHLFFEVPLAHRFLLFIVFFLQLALVWLILRVIDNWRTTPRAVTDSLAMWITVAALVGIGAYNVALVALEFRGSTFDPKTLKVLDKHGQIPGRTNVVVLYQKLTAPLSRTSVVLTTPRLGWPLPTVKGKVVSLFHENPMLLDQAERYVATMEFFYQPLDDLARAAIVRRYNASHILTYASDDSVDPGVTDWLSRYATQIVEVGDYRMYAIDVAALPVAPAELDVSAAVDDSTEQRQTESAMDLQDASVDQQEADVLDPNALPADSVDEPEEKSFGAPIAEPILDPERHGG